jgi:uncharacterized protein (TIGR02145 family)
MKKFILLLSIIALFCQITSAQTGGINFQGIARNASGAVLANQKVNLKFSILKTTETGAVEYTETKEATTNAQGIFAVVVGEVNASSFAAIDWKQAPKFLKVEMDPTGGTSFLAMGTTRLQNVPFAYYANGVNANNIDGFISIAKGGTGATDAATARTNLGLVIGTNVQAPLTAGTDYLTPTGNAATATKLATKKKINGVDFDGSTDITIPSTAEASTISGTVALSNGGTGASTASAARTNLGLVIGTNVQAPLVAGTDYLTPTGNAATATKLAAKKKINGVDFDGSSDIIITTIADANTLTGTVLNSSVTSSRLTSVGTLTNATINGKVIVGTITATSSSAIFESNSTSQGLLLPRMTFAQRNLISNPATGLMIFCSDCGTYGEWQGYNGNQWTNISGATASTVGGTQSSNSFEFNEVVSPTSRIWMDRNLGASRVATSIGDALSYGDYYQWGRGSDGHEKKTSTISNVQLSTNYNSSQFIIYQMFDQKGWLVVDNFNLWQGVSGINNPCPQGFRIPTRQEWLDEIATWTNSNGAASPTGLGGFNSVLKLPIAGKRFYQDGVLMYLGVEGNYWTSTKLSSFDHVYFLQARYNYAVVNSDESLASGHCIRCIKN